MIDETPKLMALHECYCRCSGITIKFDTKRMFVWREFAARFNAADLELVIRHLKRKLTGDRLRTALKFHYLIENLEYFEEDLAEARALVRVPAPRPNRESMLRATGRSVQPETAPARTVAEIIASENALRELLRVRDNQTL